MARMGPGKYDTRFWWGNPKEGRHLQDPVIDESIILKCILQKLDWRSWTGSIWLSTGVSGVQL